MDETPSASQTPDLKSAGDTPPGPIVYRQSIAYVLTTLGGFLLLSLIKAFLFRFDHPDLFYEGLACIVGLGMGVMLWFPPTLTISSEGVSGSQYGRKWIDLPWEAVAEINLFRTPVIKGAGGTTLGGRRALGFRVKADYRGRIRPRSPIYGYDAAIPSMWDFSLDRVTDQCLALWRAKGGSGELINLLEPQVPTSQLQLDGL